VQESFAGCDTLPGQIFMCASGIFDARNEGKRNMLGPDLKVVEGPNGPIVKVELPLDMTKSIDVIRPCYDFVHSDGIIIPVMKVHLKWALDHNCSDTDCKFYAELGVYVACWLYDLVPNITVHWRSVLATMSQTQKLLHLSLVTVTEGKHDCSFMMLFVGVWPYSQHIMGLTPVVESPQSPGFLFHGSPVFSPSGIASCPPSSRHQWHKLR
jgi:hypothetical protein